MRSTAASMASMVTGRLRSASFMLPASLAWSNSVRLPLRLTM